MSRIVSRIGGALALVVVVGAVALLPSPVAGQRIPRLGLLCDYDSAYTFTFQGRRYEAERWACVDDVLSPLAVPPLLWGQYGFCTPRWTGGILVAEFTCAWADERDPLSVLELPGSHYCIVMRTHVTYDGWGVATLGCMPRATALRAIFNR